MQSPLPTLWDTLHENEYRPEPLKADSNSFGFFLPFPGGKGYKVSNSILLRCDIEWAPREQGVFVNVALPDTDFSVVKDQQDFLNNLEQEMMNFLYSMAVFDDDDEESLPDSSFYLCEAKGSSLLTPVFSTVIEYEDDEDLVELPQRMAVHTQYSACALWLAHPVFAFIKRERREPTAGERLRELLIAHGNSQVLRPEPDLPPNVRRCPQPVIYFPDGLFGGKISKLRPQ